MYYGISTRNKEVIQALSGINWNWYIWVPVIEKILYIFMTFHYSITTNLHDGSNISYYVLSWNSHLRTLLKRHVMQSHHSVAKMVPYSLLPYTCTLCKSFQEWKKSCGLKAVLCHNQIFSQNSDQQNTWPAIPLIYFPVLKLVVLMILIQSFMYFSHVPEMRNGQLTDLFPSGLARLFTGQWPPQPAAFQKFIEQLTIQCLYSYQAWTETGHVKLSISLQPNHTDTCS